MVQAGRDFLAIGALQGGLRTLQLEAALPAETLVEGLPCLASLTALCILDVRVRAPPQPGAFLPPLLLPSVFPTPKVRLPAHTVRRLHVILELHQALHTVRTIEAMRLVSFREKFTPSCCQTNQSVMLPRSACCDAEACIGFLITFCIMW